MPMMTTTTTDDVILTRDVRLLFGLLIWPYYVMLHTNGDGTDSDRWYHQAIGSIN